MLAQSVLSKADTNLAAHIFVSDRFHFKAINFVSNNFGFIALSFVSGTFGVRTLGFVLGRFRDCVRQISTVSFGFSSLGFV